MKRYHEKLPDSKATPGKGFRYFLFNSNKKNECQVITALLASSDLSDNEKEYIQKRFMDALFSLDKLAIKNKIVFEFFRVTILLVAIAIPTVLNIPLEKSSASVIATVLSFTGALLFGILQIFKQDRIWIHHRKYFEYLRAELYSFVTLSGERYQQYSSHKEAFKIFSGEAEKTFRTEIKDYFSTLQLDNNTVFYTEGY